VVEYNYIALKNAEGQIVTSVKPSTACILVADLKNWPLYILHTEYLVLNEYGIEVLRQSIGINIATGLSYMDWVSPSSVGTYRFYPDSANRNTFITFTVSQSSGENGTIFGLSTTNLLILAGIGVAAILLVRSK
jgi:hypothetical protein